MRSFLFLVLWLSMSGIGLAQTGNTASRLLLELPYRGENNKILTDVFYTTTKDQNLQLQYFLYQYNIKGDSTLMIRKQTDPIPFKKGMNQKSILLSGNDKNTFNQAVFIELLRKHDIVAPGNYKIYVELKADSLPVIRKVFLETVDSNLAANSLLRKDISQSLLPEQKATILGVNLGSQASIANKVLDKPANAVKSAGHKIDRLFKAKGLDPVTTTANGKQYISLYYQGIFAGRYELEGNKSVSGQINKQKDQLANNVSSLTTNELTNYQSLFSQIKKLRKDKKDEKETTGEIAVTGNWANGQQEYSGQDNNYYEIRGRIETEVMDVPITLEGYYTTQDAHREVKSSFFRVHYDVEKAKSELTNLIGGYKNQYQQTLSKGAGLKQVYGSYLSNLESQKGQLLRDLKKETGVSDLNTQNFNSDQFKKEITATVEKQLSDSAQARLKKDTAGLKDGATSKLDSAGRMKKEAARAKAVKDSSERLYQKAMKRYEQIQAMEKTANKYYTLLNQYKNTSYFDSAMGVSKMKGLENGDEASYKQLAKSASSLLPDGKAKTFISGLTSLDAGIINQYTSKYTQAGQQLKGMSAGYDLGICQVNGSFGSTQYAGRDGTLDKYTTYSGSLLFKPAKGQQIKATYFGYTPAIKSDTFYSKMDVALPSFKEPVHIVSVSYEGTITKNIHIEGEGATSFRNGDNTTFGQSFDANRTAWHIDVDGMIPHTLINVTAGVEHGGKDFENSTLPVIIAGTDLYKVAAKGDFLRSFLTLGLEYNRMIQNSFASTGGNNRWGFDVSTHSKQYPSLALSYKPFATFRSYADTLNIPQRPLVGAVWTGRASYQLKRLGGKSWRFTLVYNKSTSTMDTSSYNSGLLQIGCTYTTKLYLLNVSAGNTQLSATGVDTSSPAHQDTRFVMASASYNLSKQVSITGGGDIGFAHFGFSKSGYNLGVMYRMKKTPLTIRMLCRYTSYELSLDDGWKKFYSGSAELAWKFKMKKNK